jgi:expansin (peptidoglycan-binding protein)
MITLEYFDGKKWVFVSKWYREDLAWVSLGGDDYNYRTVDEKGNVLTDKSKEPFIINK